MGYSRSLSPLPRPLLRANTFQTTRTYISHYGDKTKAFRSFDPNLKVLLGDALAKACPKGSSQNYRVANMRYNEKTHSFERTGEWTCSEKLDDSLHSAKTFDQNTCNVLLVEGFSLALYEVIGEHFDVHPSFFADHLSVTVTDDTTTSLPSRTRSSFIRGNTMLRYIESMIIEESVTQFRFLLWLVQIPGDISVLLRSEAKKPQAEVQDMKTCLASQRRRLPSRLRWSGGSAPIGKHRIPRTVLLVRCMLFFLVPTNRKLVIVLCDPKLQRV